MDGSGLASANLQPVADQVRGLIALDPPIPIDFQLFNSSVAMLSSINGLDLKTYEGCKAGVVFNQVITSCF